MSGSGFLHFSDAVDCAAVRNASCRPPTGRNDMSDLVPAPTGATFAAKRSEREKEEAFFARGETLARVRHAKPGRRDGGTGVADKSNSCSNRLCYRG
jgi:hypothetical protein